MPPTRDTFCSYCGAAYPPPLKYPRQCPKCQVTVWANPIPVAVALVPVKHQGRVGLLTVRRGIEPGKGKLALVGGFVEEHESWQAAAAREVREETNVAIDAAGVTTFWYASSDPRPNRVLLFGLAAELDAAALAPFAPNTETQERGLIFGAQGLEPVFAFPLHLEAAVRYFSTKHVSAEHGFVAL